MLNVYLRFLTIAGKLAIFVIVVSISILETIEKIRLHCGPVLVQLARVDALYRHEKRSVTPSVQEGIPHVLLLFAAWPRSSRLFLLSSFKYIFRKVSKI